MSFARAQAMEVGTLVDDALERRDASGLTGEPKAWVERALQSPLFQRADKAEEIYRELPFADGTLDGKIDLLFREGQRWVLVDYKTDEVPDATAHATQLRAYRDSLSKTAGIAVEELLVLFVRTGEVVNIA